MKALRTVVELLSLAVLIAVFASPANASDFDKLTIFTFSHPVEIPGGKVLPAGTYVFKVLDAAADRNVVQVFNKDQTKLYATFLTVFDYRPQPSDKVIVKFSETPAGGPEAIKEWFYPGEKYGWEFVYPKSRALSLAKAAKQTVPSMPSNLSSNISESAESPNEPSVTAMKDATLRAEEPSGKEVEVGKAFGNKPEGSGSASASAQQQTNTTH